MRAYVRTCTHTHTQHQRTTSALLITLLVSVFMGNGESHEEGLEHYDEVSAECNLPSSVKLVQGGETALYHATALDKTLFCAKNRHNMNNLDALKQYCGGWRLRDTPHVGLTWQVMHHCYPLTDGRRQSHQQRVAYCQQLYNRVLEHENKERPWTQSSEFDAHEQTEQTIRLVGYNDVIPFCFCAIVIIHKSRMDQTTSLDYLRISASLRSYQRLPLCGGVVYIPLSSSRSSADMLAVELNVKADKRLQEVHNLATSLYHAHAERPTGNRILSFRVRKRLLVEVCVCVCVHGFMASCMSLWL